MKYTQYKILSVESDAKTVKGSELGFLTGIFYGAPATEATKKTMCPFATAKCFADCIYDTGLATIYSKIKLARKRKTLLMLSDPQAFKALLRDDIKRLIRDAQIRNLLPAVRLNGSTDRFALRFYRDIIADFPNVQFYDYTKWPICFWINVPSNFHLTFSLSDKNEQDAMDALNAGYNVAVPFVNVPTTFFGRPVLVGDDSDLRFLDTTNIRVKDSRGFIIGLTVKGARQRKQGKNGFIR